MNSTTEALKQIRKVINNKTYTWPTKSDEIKRIVKAALSSPVVKEERLTAEELNNAAKEFAKKTFCYTDDMVAYNKDLFTGFKAGFAYASQSTPAPVEADAEAFLREYYPMFIENFNLLNEKEVMMCTILEHFARITSTSRITDISEFEKQVVNLLGMTKTKNVIECTDYVESIMQSLASVEGVKDLTEQLLAILTTSIKLAIEDAKPVAYGLPKAAEEINKLFSTPSVPGYTLQHPTIQELLKLFNRVNSGLMHFSTLDKMPTLEFIYESEKLLKHVVDIANTKVVHDPVKVFEEILIASHPTTAEAQTDEIINLEETGIDIDGERFILTIPALRILVTANTKEECFKEALFSVEVTLRHKLGLVQDTPPAQEKTAAVWVKGNEVVPPITHPLGNYWKQPNPSDILISDTHARVKPEDIKKLSEYSESIPSGVYNGKMWKMIYNGKTYLRWYADGKTENQCSIPQREIIEWLDAGII
jgi:hypothetical protein